VKGPEDILPNGQNDMTEDNRHRAALEEKGFAVLENFMDPYFLSRMVHRVEELLADEERHPGQESRWEANARRLNNLADKGEVFWEAITCKETLELVESVLGPEFKVSSFQVRSADPNSNSLQPLHIDLNLLPDLTGYRICNTLWMLDDFTLDNGPVRVIPGSHRWGRRPQDAIEDVYAPHPEELVLTGKAGTVVIMNAHLWHGAMANRTPRERRALSLFFCRRDIAQQQYQKKLLRAETQEALSGELRRLLALDDPLNDDLAVRNLAMRIENIKLMRCMGVPLHGK
jgi:ectoine hydroxylase-related dioxygenase (phytanoyl-CoA dioxygenase family)